MFTEWFIAAFSFHPHPLPPISVLLFTTPTCLSPPSLLPNKPLGYLRCATFISKGRTPLWCAISALNVINDMLSWAQLSLQSSISQKILNYLVHTSFSWLGLYAFWHTMSCLCLDSPIQLQVSSSTVLSHIKLLLWHVFSRSLLFWLHSSSWSPFPVTSH